jgi:hypothetical protein
MSGCILTEWIQARLGAFRLQGQQPQMAYLGKSHPILLKSQCVRLSTHRRWLCLLSYGAANSTSRIMTMFVGGLPLQAAAPLRKTDLKLMPGWPARVITILSIDEESTPTLVGR